MYLGAGNFLINLAKPGWSGLLHVWQHFRYNLLDSWLANSIKPLPSLKKRSEFLALRQATRYSCDAFILQGILNTGTSGLPRVGYTVTKKIGNSVERNRIRRRLRQAIATAVRQRAFDNADEAPHGCLGGEVVVVARRGALDGDYADLVSKFTKGIDRLVTKGNKAV